VKIQLRDYQEKGIEDIRVMLRRKFKAVLYVLPTGGGKTITFAYISDKASQNGNRVLILEHRKELIRQASLALAGLGVYHRIIAPRAKVNKIRRAHVEKLGKPFVKDDASVAVASVQTLARRLPMLQEFNPAMVVIDEAHHAVAGTWARIIEALPKAFLLGVTATPCRTDGQGLGDVFDCMVQGPEMQLLIDEGNLVPPKIFAPPMQFDLSGVHKRGGDLRTDEQASILDQPTITGNAVEHYRNLAPHKPAIVFCCNVRHAKHVAEQFQQAGFKFYPIFGEMDDDDRDRLIYGLLDGSVEGLVSVDVISEGTDLPAAEVAIMLRATDSESLYLQQAGRVLRPVFADGFDLTTIEGRLDAIEASDKQYGIIIDHVGNVMRHGKPHAARSWTLDGKQKREKQSDDEGAEIKIRQCPECYLVHDPAPSCPECGHIYEARVFQPREVAGQLEEMQESEEEIQRKAVRVEQGRAKSAADLMKLGHSKERANHIIASREVKEGLQIELRQLLIRWSQQTGNAVLSGWGFGIPDIRQMKPKALKENIEKVSEAVFITSASNRNQLQPRPLL
jgi:DNA repair protein RadD